MSPAPQNETASSGLSLWLVFLLLLALQALVIYTGANPLLSGQMPDTDPYIRLLRVEDLLATGDWFNNTLMRMNAPYGDTLNWTRPLDVMILAFAAPLHFFAGMDWHKALFWGGAVLPVVIYLLFGLAIAWMAEPLLGKRMRGALVLLASIQPVVFIYNLAGRPDQQTLLMIAAAMALGFIIRALHGLQSPLRAGLYAGLWSGFALWISVEFQFSFIVLTGLLALLWLWRGGLLTQRLLEGLGLGFLFMVALAVWIERGPAWQSLRELDKISFSQLIAAAINCSLWGLLAWLNQSPRGGAVRRGLTSLLCGAGALALLVFLAPEILHGPAGAIDPRVLHEFFLNIREMQPLWPTTLNKAGLMFLIIGLPLATLPLCWGLLKGRPGWLMLLGYTALFTFFALLHARFAQFAAAFAAPLALGVINLQQQNSKKTLALGMGLIAGPLLLGTALAMLALTDKDAAPKCDVPAVAEALNALPEGIIMANLNDGPELLYFTKHSVLAGPYHRNTAGILATVDFLKKPLGPQSREILEARKVKYVLACPKPDEPAEILGNQLSRGEAPAWLKPLPLPKDQDFKLYSVDRAP